MSALPDQNDLAIRVMAMPADTNPAGDIFGGWLMSQIVLNNRGNLQVVPARQASAGILNRVLKFSVVAAATCS
jgi:acyl-CoA thioesterase YciA